MSRTDLPSEKASNFQARLRETVQTLLGTRGDKLDRALTLRDVIENKLFELRPGANVGSGVVPLVPGDPGGGWPGTDPYEPDLTPPPSPDFLTATPAISHVLIEVPPATYLQGHGHLRTRIYGAKPTTSNPSPTFSDSVEVGQFEGTVWAMASDPAVTWHLWAKWESRDNALSASPAGGTNGVVATTAQNVTLMLEALVGQIGMSQLVTELVTPIAQIPGLVTGLSNEATARADADSANALATQQVQARLDTGDFAAVKVQSSASASKVSGLEAQYTVKLDVAGLISGYGLASTAVNAAPTSSFGVRAGNFFVAPPAVASATAPTTNLFKGFVWLDTSVTPNVTRYWSGTAWTTTPQTLPFIIQTVPTTINGVVVPPGVYMDSAYMRTFVAQFGQIGNLAVDDASIIKLSVAKLTAGSIAVGQYAQSTDYIAGSAGWRINGDGTAEFSGVVVRGTVYATAGQIGGITIASNAVRAGQTAYNTGSGFHLGSDGRLSLGNSAGNRLTWDGTTLNVVGGGTFTGTVSGGQFNVGAYTGYAWPAAGQSGAHLGPLGLLLGNANNGRYLQITSDGNIYTPGFNVENGVMTVNQANVINTLNIAGQAVTIPVSAYTASTMAVGPNVTTSVQSLSIASSGAPILIFAQITLAANGNYDYVNYSVSVSIRRNGSLIRTYVASPINTVITQVPLSMTDTPGVGTHQYEIVVFVGVPSTTFSISGRSLSVIETKR